ncbi:DUF6894 family protein [Methylobacterium sp. C25]|uniref:DUF6894 family protein n=1 Tax=Methylobacterium sp. C25 TaxID=2721622 RepID=UPI003FA35E8F
MRNAGPKSGQTVLFAFRHSRRIRSEPRGRPSFDNAHRARRTNTCISAPIQEHKANKAARCRFGQTIPATGWKSAVRPSGKLRKSDVPAKRYRFHSTDGWDAVFDRKGRLVERQRELRSCAFTVARILMAGCSADVDWSDWSVDVYDASGRCRMYVPFVEVSRGRGR